MEPQGDHVVSVKPTPCLPLQRAHRQRQRPDQPRVVAVARRDDEVPQAARRGDRRVLHVPAQLLLQLRADLGVAAQLGFESKP